MLIKDVTHEITQNDARKLQKFCLVMKNLLPTNTPTTVKLSIKELTKKSAKAKLSTKEFVAV
jgi:hypothetical protein